MARYASDANAYGISDRSGFRYRLGDMKKEWNGLLVGPDEYESKHPQLTPSKAPMDPQALRESRPESSLAIERTIQYGFNPVGYSDYNNFVPNNLVVIGGIGIVTVIESNLNPTDTATLTGLSATTALNSVIIADSGSTDTATLSGMSATTALGSVTITTSSTVDTTYTVTVASYLGANYFYIDGSRAATLNLSEGSTYRFDQSDSSNSNHPLRFSTTSNGTHGGGSEYTTGVTTNGTPGSSGAYSQITVASGAPTLYYYCTNHSGMGGTINT